MSTATARSTPTIALGRRSRRTVLVTHIVSAAAWIGIDIVIAILVATSAFSSSEQTRAVAYQTLGLVAVWPMLLAGVCCLVSGIMLGLGTKYGVLRFWWVAIKLCVNIVLCTLILLALRPQIDSLAEFGRLTLAGASPAAVDASQLAFPPAVSLSALLVAVVLSVFKPWGRIGKRSRT